MVKVTELIAAARMLQQQLEAHQLNTGEDLEADDAALVNAAVATLDQYAMEAAKSSRSDSKPPSEQRETLCADPSCTDHQPHVQGSAGCYWERSPTSSSGIDPGDVGGAIERARASLLHIECFYEAKGVKPRIRDLIDIIDIIDLAEALAKSAKPPVDERLQYIIENKPDALEQFLIVQEGLVHPATVVRLRAGFLFCREYMARFVESENAGIAASIRANWIPQFGDDPGPPRRYNFDEVARENESGGWDSLPVDASKEAMCEAAVVMFHLGMVPDGEDAAMKQEQGK